MDLWFLGSEIITSLLELFAFKVHYINDNDLLFSDRWVAVSVIDWVWVVVVSVRPVFDSSELGAYEVSI